MTARRGRRRPAGGVSEEIRRRHGWLELLQTSGPFLTLPVVHRVFPDGLPAVPAIQRAEVRAMVAEMLDSHGATRHAMISTMLRDILGWQHHLRIDTEVPDNLAEPVPEHGLVVRPDFGFYAENADGDADFGYEMTTTRSPAWPKTTPTTPILTKTATSRTRTMSAPTQGMRPGVHGSSSACTCRGARIRLPERRPEAGQPAVWNG